MHPLYLSVTSRTLPLRPTATTRGGGGGGGHVSLFKTPPPPSLERPWRLFMGINRWLTWAPRPPANGGLSAQAGDRPALTGQGISREALDCLSSDKSGAGSGHGALSPLLTLIFHVVFSVVFLGAGRQFIPSAVFPLTSLFSLFTTSIKLLVLSGDNVKGRSRTGSESHRESNLEKIITKRLDIFYWKKKKHKEELETRNVAFKWLLEKKKWGPGVQSLLFKNDYSFHSAASLSAKSRRQLSLHFSFHADVLLSEQVSRIFKRWTSAFGMKHFALDALRKILAGLFIHFFFFKVKKHHGQHCGFGRASQDSVWKKPYYGAHRPLRGCCCCWAPATCLIYAHSFHGRRDLLWVDSFL